MLRHAGKFFARWRRFVCRLNRSYPFGNLLTRPPVVVVEVNDHRMYWQEYRVTIRALDDTGCPTPFLIWSHKSHRLKSSTPSTTAAACVNNFPKRLRID